VYESLCSAWVEAGQAIVAIVGTFLTIHGLKRHAERAGTFDTMNPYPTSYRMWVGFSMIVIAGLLPVVRALIGGCHKS
jgi:hypothetical protein